MEGTALNDSSLYNEKLTKQLEIEDNAVENLFLMNNPWPVLTILASYLYFVLRGGPQYMSNRKAYNLKGFMVLYNFIQVLYNGWFLFWMTSSGLIPFLFRQSCYPEDVGNVTSRLLFLRGAWVWFLLKVIDLMDTVIFILRKKHSQVSFLHVYHHTAVVLSTWLHIKYVRGEQAVIIGFANTLVHAVMYSYYLLAALGPSVQPYLWWKKHLTKLQMVQFVCIFGWFSYLTLGCKVPMRHKVYNWFAISQAIIFFVLFMQFYFRAYDNKSSKSKEHTK